MIQITITMDENGEFKVEVSEGLPLFTAIGALEIAKNILATEDAKFAIEPDSTEGLQ